MRLGAGRGEALTHVVPLKARLSPQRSAWKHHHAGSMFPPASTCDGRPRNLGQSHPVRQVRPSRSHHSDATRPERQACSSRAQLRAAARRKSRIKSPFSPHAAAFGACFFYFYHYFTRIWGGFFARFLPPPPHAGPRAAAAALRRLCGGSGSRLAKCRRSLALLEGRV